jgi:hypothetical protein
MTLSLKKAIGYLLTALMPALVLLSWYLQSYYVDHRPLQPTPSVGQIVSLNVHGTTVYLTGIEYVVAEYSFFVGIIAGLVGGAILQGSKRWQSPK